MGDRAAIEEEHTFMAQVHLGLHRLEVVRGARLGFSAHLLPSPLLEAIELFIDVHGSEAWWVPSLLGGCCAQSVCVLWGLRR